MDCRVELGNDGVRALCVVSRLAVSLALPRKRGSGRAERGVAVVQIRSGKRMMKLSRFGIFTLGSVCAFIASSSGMSLLAAKR